MSLKADVVQRIRARANNRCEYCLMPNGYAFQPHQIDHIVALKHDGDDSEDNLCLSCHLCNAYKGSDVSSFDPITKLLIRLFNPRSDVWETHFRLNGVVIEGITAIGRATAKLLRINDTPRVLLRRQLYLKKLYP